MRKKVIILASLCFLVGGILFLWQGRLQAAKTVSVSKESELRTQLAKEETSTINLSGDITLTAKLTANGTKTIDGKGYTIRRKTEKGKQYYGSLCTVSGTLTLKNVTVNGCGKNTNMAAGATDRLIRVSGKLVLDTGAILQQNYKANKSADCGGAIYVGSKGTAVMKKGSVIQDNRSQTGGAAVRIVKGGTFTMEGGTIRENQVEATSTEEDYQGLGGAIHNRGTVIIRDGVIEKNVALQNKIAGVQQGGIGGGIYSFGKLTIKGGKIRNNQAADGAGLYVSGNSSATMEGGSIYGNSAGKDGVGGGIFINNGSQFEMKAGEIYSNRANTGGGVYVSKEQSRFALLGGWIYSNQSVSTSTFSGPGIRNNGATIQMSGGNLNAKPGGIIAENQNPSCSSPYRGSAMANTGGGKVTIAGGRIYSDDTGGEPLANESDCSLTYQSPSGTGITGRGKYAIYNKGALQVKGAAELTGEYQSMIYNKGNITVTDGTIQGPKCGVENYGLAKIRGGIILGRQYGIMQKAGRLVLGSKPHIEKVYLAKTMVIEEENLSMQSTKIQITPKDYYDGRLVERAIYKGGSGENFWKQSTLTPKDVYYLYWQGTDVRIGQESYQLQFDSNGGEGSMPGVRYLRNQKERLPVCRFVRAGYKFLGWGSKKQGEIDYHDEAEIINLAKNGEVRTLYAIWGKKPELHLRKETLSFYEGEKVGKDIMLLYVEAKDERDGDLTKDICWEEVVYANGEREERPERLDTSCFHLGDAYATYTVTNSLGIQERIRQKIQIEKNEAPELITKKRYYFQSEIQEMTNEQLFTDLREGIQWFDQEDKEKGLTRYLQLDTGQLDKDNCGEYRVKVSIRDQYGNRFYMEPEEEGEYGEGKRTEQELCVVVVKDSEKLDRKEGHVRFIDTKNLEGLEPSSKWNQLSLFQELQVSLAKSGSTEQCRQVWHFDSIDIQKAKRYMKQLEDPFERQSNRGFLAEFQNNRIWNLVKGGEKE